MTCDLTQLPEAIRAQLAQIAKCYGVSVATVAATMIVVGVRSVRNVEQVHDALTAAAKLPPEPAGGKAPTKH